ncbi:MAG TPA: IPT/TIG domain-containing protein [Vicinamibacteria bacterium]
MSEPSQEPTHPVLIVTGPPRDGDELALESLGFEKALGSGPDCHFRLQAGNVDFNHARVVWEGRGVLLTDLGSAAGTYVNGEKIGSDYALQDGDRICLGPPGSKQSVKLLARVPAESAMPAPLVLAPEQDEFGLGKEPPPLQLLPADPEPAAASVPPSAFVPLPGAGAAPVLPTPAPPAPAERPGLTTPAIIFDTPVAPPRPEPSRPRPLSSELSELPSIEPPARSAGDASDESDEPAPRRERRRAAPARPARSLPSIPPIVWIALVLLVLGGGAFMAYTRLRPPLPTLTALLPPQAAPRQSLVLTGTGFADNPAGNTVRIGTRTVPVTAATATQVTVTVPGDLETGGSADVPVVVETSGGQSNPVFLRVRKLPHGLKLYSDVAEPGSELVITGQNLDVKPLAVRVAGIPADVVENDAGRVHFRVPADLPFQEGRSVPVTVAVGNDSAPALQLLLGRLPLVTEIAPRSGRPGDRVTLRGRGFDPAPAANTLTFGAEPALVLSASETEIQAVVPPVNAAAGELDIPVVVKARGSTSSGGRTFAVQRPSASVFVPHFFAAPVPEDPSAARVFVSTALGPVLLLAGRDGAPSPAERAVRVAAALDAAFSARKPIVLRDTPTPALVAGERGEVVVSVTSADAAAYAPPIVPASTRPTARAVAAHWAAVLQDMQALFVERQRPVRVVQASARGKVLLDLYAEAERLGGPGSGVPTRLVEPLPMTVARGFREMTLMVPAQGQAVAAAAVTGTWRGTLQEDGVGERPLQLRLSANGTRLSGAVTSRAGAVGMEIPVLDVSYDKGVLTFRTTSGAAARRYRATLQGATLAGTVHTADAKDAVVGRFTLRYTE